MNKKIVFQAGECELKRFRKNIFVLLYIVCRERWKIPGRVFMKKHLCSAVRHLMEGIIASSLEIDVLIKFTRHLQTNRFLKFAQEKRRDINICRQSRIVDIKSQSVCPAGEEEQGVAVEWRSVHAICCRLKKKQLGIKAE